MSTQDIKATPKISTDYSSQIMKNNLKTKLTKTQKNNIKASTTGAAAGFKKTRLTKTQKSNIKAVMTGAAAGFKLTETQKSNIKAATTGAAAGFRNLTPAPKLASTGVGPSIMSTQKSTYAGATSEFVQNLNSQNDSLRNLLGFKKEKE